MTVEDVEEEKKNENLFEKFGAEKSLRILVDDLFSNSSVLHKAGQTSTK